jgi:hypothetical protein
MPYRLLIDIEVFDQLQSLPAARRRTLFARFRLIGIHPIACSDYVDRDESGRRVDVSVVDGFAIYYWTDEADRQVKILELIVAGSLLSPLRRARFSSDLPRRSLSSGNSASRAVP